LDGRVYDITASVGIVGATSGDRDSNYVLRRADTAMYHAKDMGRDRIESNDRS